MNEEIIKSLMEDGIYQGTIPTPVIDYWDKTYFTNITTNEKTEFKNEFNQYYYLLNNQDKFIYQYFFKNILDSISFIYQKPAKIRDIFAVLTLPPEKNKEYRRHVDKWHTDGENSFGLMVLINNITLNDMHMKFITTNDEKYPIRYRTKELDTTNKNIKDCIGDAGTFYLFDNGHNLHKLHETESNKQRKTIHAIYLPYDHSAFV